MYPDISNRPLYFYNGLFFILFTFRPYFNHKRAFGVSHTERPSLKITLFMRSRALFEALLYRNSTRHGRADHGVVAHADQAHHFHVRRNRRRTRKLRVAVHTAH